MALTPLRKPPPNPPTLQLLHKLVIVDLKVASLPHAPIPQQTAPHHVGLARNLLPQIVLGESYFVRGVDGGDGVEVGVDGGLEEGGNVRLHSEQEGEDLFGVVVRTQEDGPHAVGEMDSGIISGVGGQGDGELEGGDEVFLEILEKTAGWSARVEVLRV
jgi:hypothetical protein